MAIDERFDDGHWRAIKGELAWRQLASSSHSRWTTATGAAGYATTARGRIAGGIVLPQVTPKFQLRADDIFFCIGSCFARNIEEHLMYRDFSVTSMSITASRNEWPWRPNGFLNKFTTSSILNEMRWAFGEAPFPEKSFLEDGNGWHDLQLSPGVAGVTRERVTQRRRMVTEYFARIHDASVVIITLGLVEVWYDHAAEVFLNTAPSLWATRREPDRFSLIVSDYGDNLRALNDIIALLERHGRKDVRVIVTVSPVPMSETFTGQDVIVANNYSKSTLRAAAEDAARERENVQYYPSYDAIVTSQRSLAYNSGDELHVLDQAVEEITSHFLTAFGISRARMYPDFVETEYLFANSDVHDAVLAGDIPSGYEHWLRHGRSEGRPLRRPEKHAAP